MLKSRFLRHSIAAVIIIMGALSSQGAGYLLDNLTVLPRQKRGADESWRIFVPKPAKEGETKEYKPVKLTEYQKKVKIAEEYIVEAFPKDFKIDKVVEKNSEGNRLKRPISYKYNKKKIIIHHTAESAAGLDSIEKEKEAVQGIYKFHTFSRDRGDIGYNYLIAPSGTIFQGRYGGSDAVAAHAVRNNSDSIGISLLGNFDKEKPTQAQIDALTKLLVAIGHSYQINPFQKVIYHTFSDKIKEPHIHNIELDSIVAHSDVGSTSCAGKYLYGLLPTIKRAVAKELTYAKANSKTSEKNTITTITTNKTVNTYIKSPKIITPVIKRIPKASVTSDK